MRVNLRWLNEYVHLDVPLKKLVELLDLSGTKVEAVHRRSEAAKGVIVAEVRDHSPHPKADKLTLVDVDPGDGDVQRVVCGVRNYDVGDKVPLATVGARLGDMEIAERQIRGETSRGMLCSAAELSLARDHSGIFILPPDAPLGEEVGALLDLDAVILELEITPNRPDCMGMIGIAREVSALLGSELKVPDPVVQPDRGLASPVQVQIDDPTGCPRYVARYLDGVTMGPAPLKVVKRLLSAGVRPISNVVDATNYVMLETGQPLHAFDAAGVGDARIVVRRARTGERLRTLDGIDRELHPKDLMIADPGRALALAGLMGGEESEVSDATTSVILESACFDPATIAYASRRHGLRTEASARFERGTDPNGVSYAAARAAQLIADSAGARVAPEESDAYPAPVEPRQVTLRPRRTNAIIGGDTRADLQATRLRSIGLEVVEGAETLQVSVPTFRPDLKREIDLVEEVARLEGFESIPSTVPPGRTGGLAPDQRALRRIRYALAALGLHEAWTAAFISSKDVDALGLPPDHPARSAVGISNPMTEDEAALRTTLLPALLKSAGHNHARRVQRLALFEMARIYEPSGNELPHEAGVLGAVMYGDRRSTSWSGAAEPWDFFAAKGVIQSLVEALRLPEIAFEPVVGAPFHPTRAAAMSLDGKPLGALGEVHPDVCDRFAVPERTVVFELALPALLGALPDKALAEDPPRYPPVLIDLAVVVREEVPAKRVEEVITELGGADVAEVRLFDLYRGDQIEAGMKSLAFGLEIRAMDRTLTDQEAMAVRERIVTGLTQRLGARLRG